MVSRPKHGLSLCSGGGGLDLGLMLAEPGFHTRCFVEWEEYPRSALIAGQRAGYFAPAPIWDDLTTFDASPFRGCFDAVLAGYPCQPFSTAGQRKGADDERHLWPDVARVIRECGPEWVFLENVAGHVTLGLEAVLRELWDMGFTPAAGIFTAAETGAPHERERVFIVAHCAGAGRAQWGSTWRAETAAQGRNGMVTEPERCGGGSVANTDSKDRRANSGQPDAGPDWRNEPAGGRRELGHAAGIGRGEGWAEPEFRGGRPSSAIAGGAMADASGPEREGQQRGQHHARGRQEPDGYSALPGRTGVHPPGPADIGRWRETLATAPHLAPATGLADCLAWASDMAAAVEGAEQAQAEPDLRRMADGLALRSRALRLLGNGVHPLAAANAWRALAAAHGLRPVDLEADSADSGAASTLAV